MGTRSLWIALLLAVLQYARASPCTQCSMTSLTRATCSANDGCVDGSSLIAGSPFSGCITLMCPGGEYLLIDPLPNGGAGDVLTCGDPTAWLDEYDVVVTTAACIKGFSCVKKTPLKSTCNGNTAAKCSSVDLTRKDELTCDTGKILFYKDAGQWAEAYNIHCDPSTGVWKRGHMALDLKPMQRDDEVICAEFNPSQPGPVLCTARAPMQSKCPPAASTDAICETIPSITDDTPITCPTFSNSLYYSKDNRAWTVVAGNTATCLKSNGEWIHGTSLKSPLIADNVVCADKPPNPKKADCPVTLKTDCTQDWKTNFGCDEPARNVVVDCAPKKLYFKRAQGDKFQEAISIDCTYSGQLKYNYGRTLREEYLLTDGDHIICATINPDKNACKLNDRWTYVGDGEYKIESPPQPFEAGTEAQCLDPTYEIYSDSPTLTVYPDELLINKPICQPDGTWKFVEEDMGAKIQCRAKKCQLLCDLTNLPEFTTPVSMVRHAQGATTGQPLKSLSVGGKGCKHVNCPGGDNRFSIKMLDGSIRYYGGQIRCDKNGGFEDVEANSVQEATCVQKLYCHDPATNIIDTVCPSEITDCTPIVLPSTDNDGYMPLKCNGKKILIKKQTEQFWDEVKTMKCHEDKGEWMVDLLEGKSELRDYKNTVICADNNPAPRPTTTTTTTTPPPLRPICDVCREALEGLQMFTCETCSSNDTKLEQEPVGGEPAPGDTCLLNPAKGRELIINNFEEVKPPLICKREVGKWTTRADAPIYKFSARLLTKKDAWKALSYVVVGAVFVAIGGMGITCVVIFMKMRKQPSSREKKKKERGVTKKYTSSNVVKTDNKSRGMSKEGGKSKEGSASKNESNIEDAPTLKL